MKKRLGLLMAGLCVAGVAAWAGSPARIAGSVATTGTAFAVPVSGGVGFRLQHVVFAAAAGTTQTVALVQGSVTNQIGTKIVSATDRMLVVTNAPWLFAGDAVRVTTTATNAYNAVLTGETQD